MLTPLEAAFIAVVVGMPLPDRCWHIPMPDKHCADLAFLKAKGAYFKGSNLILLDEKNCDDPAIMRHEITHYLQHHCGLLYSEEQATEMEKLR